MNDAWKSLFSNISRSKHGSMVFGAFSQVFVARRLASMSQNRSGRQAAEAVDRASGRLYWKGVAASFWLGHVWPFWGRMLE